MPFAAISRRTPYKLIVDAFSMRTFIVQHTFLRCPESQLNVFWGVNLQVGSIFRDIEQELTRLWGNEGQAIAKTVLGPGSSLCLG